MAFIDEIKLHMKAGRGGNGVVRWRHEKGKDKAGAAGGNGGKGGDVYVTAIRDHNLLGRYRQVKEFYAENGQGGMKSSMNGKNGKDLFIEFPVGSVITNLSTGKSVSLDKDGESIKILTGGRGGLGNEYFKASTNVRPKESTTGKEGEEADFHIELELVADIGLVGLPNAGKSSLLNALTNAKAKVGNYSFTTLEPNLGDMFGYIMAGIPGLIEGASEGKGLGHAFLRHIRRTSMIAHCISVEGGEEADVVDSWETIREELETYGHGLEEKPEVIILTKTDMAEPAVVEKQMKKLSKLTKHTIFTVSVHDEASVKALKDALIKELRGK